MGDLGQVPGLVGIWQLFLTPVMVMNMRVMFTTHPQPIRAALQLDK